MKYSKTEKDIVSINVFGERYAGCQKFKKDIMISYSCTKDDEIIDLFLTKKQAQELLKSLGKRLVEHETLNVRQHFIVGTKVFWYCRLNGELTGERGFGTIHKIYRTVFKPCLIELENGSFGSVPMDQLYIA